MKSIFGITLVITIVLLCIGNTRALNNGLGLTPPMGWNSWNAFYCSINSSLVLATIDAFVLYQLPKYGYQYVNIDDCWSINRTNTGVLIPDPITFPEGIEYIVNYAHSKGMKFGIYSDCGTYTCAGRPGSGEHEYIDASTFARWGIDYLKYDNCNAENGPPLKQRYKTMRDALNATGRPIFFSLCEWGVQQPWRWAQSVGNSWRIGGDISDNWDSLMRYLDLSVGLSRYSGIGGWNDPDMLEIGDGGMNTQAYQIHFAFWCLLKAPLLLGFDMTKNISSQILTIITNEDMIALNQDPLGIQGDLLRQEGPIQVWATTLHDGSRAVIILNRQDKDEVTLHFQELGYARPIKAFIRDLQNRVDLGIFTSKITVTVHSFNMVALKITPTIILPDDKNWRPWYEHQCYGPNTKRNVNYEL